MSDLHKVDVHYIKIGGGGLLLLLGIQQCSRVSLSSVFRVPCGAGKKAKPHM